MAKRKKRVTVKGGMMNCHIDMNSCKSRNGCGYFLGVIGAAIYYLSTATGFWSGVLGLLKALVWPAFLVFEALKFIGA